MIIRKLRRQDIENTPYLIWNTFVDLLTGEEYEQLNDIQRVAYLCFWYDAEVQNGGHLQYFENRGVSHLEQTLKALSVLGAQEQRAIIENAGQELSWHERKAISSVEEYVRIALEGQFSDFDSAYFSCLPSIGELLEKYLTDHQGDFVIVD